LGGHLLVEGRLWRYQQGQEQIWKNLCNRTSTGLDTIGEMIRDIIADMEILFNVEEDFWIDQDSKARILLFSEYFYLFKCPG